MASVHDAEFGTGSYSSRKNPQSHPDSSLKPLLQGAVTAGKSR